MAIYYCDFEVYSRPKSSVSGAAYVSRSKIYDGRAKKFRDFRHLAADLVWTGTFAPPDAPTWATDRAQLWNEVEKREDRSTRRGDAQTQRRLIAAIPRELTREQGIALCERFLKEQFVVEGMVADAGIHCDTASDGGDQPHLHANLTMRAIGPDGFGNKRRDWNDVDFGNKAGAKKAPPRALEDGFLERRRKLWAVYCNEALADAGSDARVDHRSYEAQGINQRPTKPHGLSKRLKTPNAKHRAIIEHNREVGLLNEVLRTGMGIGLAIERGSLPLIAGEVIGETLGRAAAEQLVKPAIAAATRLLYPETGR